MSGVPLLPRFTDGQALAAADLDLMGDNARNQAARHQRAQHTPGIAQGLTLESTDLPLPLNGVNVVTKRIVVRRGIAVDGFGRQIVVPDDELLAPELFLDTNGDTPEIDPDFTVPSGTSFPHPVLLSAHVRAGPAPAFTGGPCGGGGGAAIVLEDFQLRVGRRTEHQTLAGQRLPGPGDDLNDDDRPFQLLLGFVRFHGELRRYVWVSDQSRDGVALLRAGVRAGEVVSGGHRLLMRLGDPAAVGQPALTLEADPSGGRLRFGLTSSDGGVTEAFSVTATGQVTAAGPSDLGKRIGEARVQSGIATDGMPLPLPPGVTEKEVEAGDYVIHIHIRPVFPASGGPYAVGRCEVDAQRIGHCTLYALREAAASAAVPRAVLMNEVFVATFEYLVLAAVAKAPGSSP